MQQCRAPEGIRDRIAKLLALSASPNENEAKAALLKARKLMAEHKLTSAEVLEGRDEQVREVKTLIDCTKNRDPWAIDLANAIAKSHCCGAVLETRNRARTHLIKFWGLGDDPEIAANIYAYAHRYVAEWQKRFRIRNKGASARGLRPYLDGYGYGFVAGVREMYRMQNQECHECGLMVVVPRAVSEATGKLKRAVIQAKGGLDEAARNVGYQDGLKFDPSTKLPDGKQ